MNILISGGSGYLGKKISKILKQGGHTVRILTRNVKGRHDHYFWDPENGKIDISAIQGINAIVHLAGAGIADKRWSSEYKKVLESSRVDTALFLKNVLEKEGIRPDHVISAAAVGYYGNRGKELLPESAPPGADYLSQLCVKWENAAKALGDQSEHLTILRLGVIMGRDSSFVKRITPFVKWHVGAALGNGNQIVPWIHSSDVVRLIALILNGKIPPDTYNVASPDKKTNKEIMKMFAKSINRRILLPPVPGFVLDLLYGEMKIALLESENIDVNKLIKAGFEYEFPTLQEDVFRSE